jgi:ethanolamine utilization protein EutN
MFVITVIGDTIRRAEPHSAMQIALVKGRATSTVKHHSLAGRKLLVCQILGCDGQDAGDPVLVLDNLGAGAGDRVVITSDFLGLRAMLGHDDSPARWWTLGIVDP